MRTSLALLLAAALTLAAGAASAKPPVWIIRDADSTIVLFGSVHVLPGGLDWRPDALTAALASADDVWFETPIDDDHQIEAQHLFQSRGMLPAGDNLFRHLTPEQGERLRRVADSLGFYPLHVARMRPWYADVQLSQTFNARSGGNASDGVEIQIQALAPLTASRHAFETTAQQVEFFAGAPVAAQVASLDETLKEIEQTPDLFDGIVGHWMAADIAAVETDAIDTLRAASPVLFDRLITQRNRRWVRVIRRRLAGHGTTVIVVGVGHLVGPGGVPALLRAQGVLVEGP
jgi:uncharacterized protein YbaP (TraB family)